MQREDSLSSSGVTTGHQFGYALDVTETLKEQADRAQEKADRLLTVELGIIAIAIAIITVVFALSPGIIRPVIVLIIVGAVGLTLAVAIHIVVRVPLRNQAERDNQAVVDIVSLLREVLPLVADVEKWNETEMRLAKVRLSRLPIGKRGLFDE
jgi:hypothetical protein